MGINPRMIWRNEYNGQVKKVGYDNGRWVCYWWFVGWDCISLGLHVCSSNVEIHLPFGFIRVGRPSRPMNPCKI